MKIFLTICCSFLIAVVANAQQLHFAYLQTDMHKPFYVILNKKTYSSTTSGYIILPKLQNGDFPIRIGFAKNEVAEQEYLLQVKDADQGLLIKDFGDKGWGLFNMQTMAIQYAGVAAQERAKLAAAEKAEAERVRQQAEQEALAIQAKRREDSVQSLVATQKQYADSVAAVEAQNTIQRNYNDSMAIVKKLSAQQANDRDSISKAIVIAGQQKRYADSLSNAQSIAAQQKSFTDSVNKAKATDAENERLEKIAAANARAKEAVIEKEKKAEATIPEKKKDVATPDTTPQHSVTPGVQVQPPVLLQQLFTDSGWQFTYRITNQNQRETVNAFIPSAQPKIQITADTPALQKDTIAIVPVQTVDSVKSQPIILGQDTTSVKQKILPDTIQKSQPIIAGNIDTKPTITTDTIVPQVEKSIFNSNCKAVADEKDFYNTRRKIASAVGTEQMLAAARKQLKDKCYTTEQLRNLCVLFLTDAGRYQFLDTAYPFTFDAYHFHLLQDLLLDDYYIQRFKTMLR